MMDIKTLVITFGFGITGWFTLIAAMVFEEFRLVERAASLRSWGRYLLSLAAISVILDGMVSSGFLAWLVRA